jgi:hypothetical protein
MSSTADAYNKQLDKCNRQIQDVSFSFLFNSSNQNSVPVSQKTHYISITKIRQLNAVWENICCLL